MMHRRALITGFLCALISAVFVLPAIAAEDKKQTADKDLKHAKAVTKMSATGNVYFLNEVEDFAGKYTASTQTAMIGSSKVTATYKNDKGITIDLRGEIEGVGLGLGAEIATVELVKQ